MVPLSKLFIRVHHFCSECSPRFDKDLLPYGLCHSKLAAKPDIVSFCLLSFLRKSSHHLMSKRLDAQSES